MERWNDVDSMAEPLSLVRLASTMQRVLRLGGLRRALVAFLVTVSHPSETA